MVAADNWQKSSFSGGGEGNACLELTTRDNTLLLRESDDPTTVLKTSDRQFTALIRHLRTE